MPQDPRRPRYPQQGKYPPYPGYGQIPIATPPSIFTPPFNPNAGRGVPVSAPIPGSPQVVSGGSNQQIGAYGEQPALTPQQQAAYTPDLQPPPGPGSKVKEFFQRLTSQPNANSLLTAGSILSSAPYPGESPLAQAVRAIGGAMSTRGAYAQAQVAQQEAARKANIEERKLQNDTLTATSGAERNADLTRIGDRTVDVDEKKLAADAADKKAKLQQDKAEFEGLTAYRNERVQAEKNKLTQSTNELQLAKDKFQQDIKNAKNDRDKDNAKQLYDEAQNRIKNEIAWARVGISRANSANTADALKKLKYWNMALDIDKATKPLGDFDAPQQDRLNTIQKIADDLEKKGTGPVSIPGGSPSTPAEGTVKEGTVAVNPSTGQKIMFKGGKWVSQ